MTMRQASWTKPRKLSAYKHGCALGCEGIVSKRLHSPYRAGRTDQWIKVKNPAAPAVKREGEEDWGGKAQTLLTAAPLVKLPH